MDYKQLKDYLAEKHEIREITARLDRPFCLPEFYAHSTILDYRKGYPRPQLVSGFDTESEKAARQRWEKRLERLKVRTREVEDYIDNLPDSRTRRCFTMYFLDGVKESAIAHTMHLDQSIISRVIRAQLKRDGIV